MHFDSQMEPNMGYQIALHRMTLSLTERKATFFGVQSRMAYRLS